MPRCTAVPHDTLEHLTMPTRPSLTTRVLIGLGAGLAAGAAVEAMDSAAAVTAVEWIEPIGRIWVNALRMTIVPLVVAGLVVGAASARANTIGRLGGRALLLFLAMLSGAAAFTVLVGPPLFALLPIDAAAAAALRGSADAATLTQTGFPDFRQWLVDLVPQNAVRAAADGAMLPLIVFALALGLAIGRIGAAERDTMLRFFRGLFDAMLTLIRWILELAPYGVFALALPLASRLGLAAAGAVAYYIVAVSAICIIAIALLYPIAALLGRVPVRQFARAAAPGQALALSSRSSLAALPAMIDAGARHLGFGTQMTSFFLPLSASMFRVGGAIGIPAGVLFIAALYGVELGPAQLLTVAITSVLVTFSVPGVPGGSILIMMPVMMSVGVPPEGVGILLGIDTIPDMFRTTANVTGHMAAATILRHEGEDADVPTGGVEAPAGAPADLQPAGIARPQVQDGVPAIHES
jgi:proton glutamate symport protein